MNPTHWARLVELRERRLQQAQEAVARERREVRAAANGVQDATAERERCVAFKQAQAQALVQSVARGERALPQLREAESYGRLLESMVEQAHRLVLTAQVEHNECLRRLGECLNQQHRAAAELRAAQEMRLRVDKELARLREQRSEDELDETARQRWQAVRHPPAAVRAA